MLTYHMEAQSRNAGYVFIQRSYTYMDSVNLPALDWKSYHDPDQQRSRHDDLYHKDERSGHEC